MHILESVDREDQAGTGNTSLRYLPTAYHGSLRNFDRLGVVKVNSEVDVVAQPHLIHVPHLPCLGVDDHRRFHQKHLYSGIKI